MTYNVTFERKPGYLHATVTGQNTRENVMDYLEDILFECMTRKFTRVLIEERLEGPRLGTLEVFSIASQDSSKVREVLTAIAYVDVYAEGNLMKFAEDVAVNRGMPVAAFATVAEAEKWLLRGS